MYVRFTIDQLPSERELASPLICNFLNPIGKCSEQIIFTIQHRHLANISYLSSCLLLIHTFFLEHHRFSAKVWIKINTKQIRI